MLSKLLHCKATKLRQIALIVALGYSGMAVADGYISNISTRAPVDATAENAMYTGFIVSGSGTKKVYIRAIGQGLRPVGVNTALSPVLELINANTNTVVAKNDGWESSSWATEIRNLPNGVYGYAPPPHPSDAAMILDLAAGSYIAKITTANNTSTGVGIVAVDEIGGSSTAKLVNVSTRAPVYQGAENYMYGGFIVTGGEREFFIRAVGKGLRALGVNTSLNPGLEIFDQQAKKTIFTNESWIQDANSARLPDLFRQKNGVTPDNDDAGMIVCLQPGVYSPVIKPLNNSSGVGIVAIDNLGSCGGSPEPSPEPEPPKYVANYSNGETIEFGTVTVNDSKTREITVMNKGDSDLLVGPITVKGTNAEFFKVSGGYFNVLPGNSKHHNLTVTCSPTKKGSIEAPLELLTNDPSNTKVNYNLSCEGKVEFTCPPVDISPIEAEQNTVVSLGFGYDKRRDLNKPQSCLNGTNAQVGAVKANIDFALIGDYEQFKRELDMSASLKAGSKVKQFKINTRTEFAMKNQNSKLSKSMFLKSEQFFTQQFNHSGLNQFGHEMFDRGEQCFISACGSDFVYQTEVGGRLIIAMKFDFSSEESKEKFFFELGASYKAVDVKLAVSRMKESDLKGSSVTLQAVQIGGSADKLAHIFGSGQAPVISCSLNTIRESAEGESCIETAMNNAIAYARDVFAPSVQARPDILRFESATYNSAGIQIPVEDVPMEIITARSDLIGKYEKYYRDFYLVESWLNGDFRQDFSHQEINYLSTIKTNISSNIDLIRNAGLWCFSDLSKCLDKKYEAYSRLKIYDESWLYGIRAVEKNSTLVELVPTDMEFLIDFYEKNGLHERCGERTESVCLPSPDCKLDENAENAGYSYEIHSAHRISVGPQNTIYVDSGGKSCLRTYIRVCAEKRYGSNAWYKATHKIHGLCPQSKEVVEMVLQVPPIL